MSDTPIYDYERHGHQPGCYGYHCDRLGCAPDDDPRDGQRLRIGHVYPIERLVCVGWTEGDGTGTEGYNAWDYFDLDGRFYVGPDRHGIEPLFEEID